MLLEQWLKDQARCKRNESVTGKQCVASKTTADPQEVCNWNGMKNKHNKKT